MNINEIVKNIDIEKVMEAIALNEISGNTAVAYRFSRASGGNSGYSFGRSQFDVSNNKAVSQFLRNKCNFSNEDINTLLRLDKNISKLNNKLREHKKKIDEYDLQHTKEMINHITNLSGLPELENEKVFVHLVDYHNQFNLSINGKMHKYLQSLKFITSENVLNFKLRQTKWGKEHSSDVIRRYNNIEYHYQHKEGKNHE